MSDLEWRQYPAEKPADTDINKLFLIRCFFGKEGNKSRAYQWIGPIPETQYHPLPGE